MLAKDGNVSEEVMYNTYNMGVGMVVAVDRDDVDRTVQAVRQAGETSYVIGEVVAGEKGVTLE